MTGQGFPGFRFDGRTAAAVPIILHLEGDHVRVETGEGRVLDEGPIGHAHLSERFRHAPRLIALPNGSILEVEDGDGGLERELLARVLVPVSPVVRLQGWWPAVLVALAGIVAIMATAYFKGVPIVARWAAFALPPSAEQRMGEQVLAVLDEHYLVPSTIDVEKRTHLTRRFGEAVAKMAPGVSWRLEFRSTPTAQVNAFALPGGTIVLLDGLVHFARSDDAVLGVLGHELGHIVHKHGVRQLFQSMGVGVLASLLWGDFSGVAASAPVALGMLRYSRGFESEADEFAVRFLRLNDVSVGPLYEFFSRVHQREINAHVEYMPDFLATHPATTKRMLRLREELNKERALSPR